jgi:tRNA U34 5-methylaminomethyl-2-thiouridine-forming methyltransferase MnmC
MTQIIETSDGSHTIFIPEMNEHYHSIHGAVQESRHIFINSGMAYCDANPLNIYEVGFGTGLNALLTAVKSGEALRVVNYTTIEKLVLNENIINSLNYKLFTGPKGPKLFELIHSAPWNQMVNISKYFNLKKVVGDLTSEPPVGKYNLIYFDAFGPDKQPEMWSREIFESIAAVTVKDGILVTYSAKGEVKRNLIACGFDVTLLPGPPGKRQIIRAVKK